MHLLVPSDTIDDTPEGLSGVAWRNEWCGLDVVKSLEVWKYQDGTFSKLLHAFIHTGNVLGICLLISWFSYFLKQCFSNLYP
jgi:hypothetical protein